MSGRSSVFEHLVIRPTLSCLNIKSISATKLLLGTAWSETAINTKIANNDGIGIFGISSAQHRQAWDQYLAYRPELASKIRSLASRKRFLQNPDDELAINLAYATAIAWIIYEMAEEPLPEIAMNETLASFWQHYFHKGTPTSWHLPVANSA
jgi:hypothetical protein